mmetsp:Transcript_24477/g.43975  ORF Transcript_24477/g.43975 Transcript_24477/m.43975 type:complete len:221 (-) Transcript_24477:2206-2868(-)
MRFYSNDVLNLGFWPFLFLSLPRPFRPSTKWSPVLDSVQNSVPVQAARDFVDPIAVRLDSGLDSEPDLELGFESDFDFAGFGSDSGFAARRPGSRHPRGAVPKSGRQPFGLSGPPLRSKWLAPAGSGPRWRGHVPCASATRQGTRKYGRRVDKGSHALVVHIVRRAVRQDPGKGWLRRRRGVRYGGVTDEGGRGGTRFSTQEHASSRHNLFFFFSSPSSF